jgi:hypothetical protein
VLVCAAAVTVVSGVSAQPGPGGPVVGKPVQPQPLPESRQVPQLPTDSLLSPVPAAPPRTAYQRPPTGPADPLGLTLPPGALIPLPQNPGRSVRFAPRYGRGYVANSEPLPDGSERTIFTGGVIVYVSPGPDQPEIEFATDDAVIWRRGHKPGGASGSGFEVEPGNQVEVYLSGNVIVRTVSNRGAQSFTQTLRAKEVYYDVPNNRAVALNADLELSTPKLTDSLHLTGKEIRRLDLENWEALSASAFSSKLPSDPGLRFDSNRVTLHERMVDLTNIFGIPYRDFQGNRIPGYERTLTIRNAVTRVDEVPVFYWPYIRTDLSEPLGPLLGIGGGMDRIFGTQVYTTWDMYKILALRPPPGHRWRLNADYLGDRGPALGSDYSYSLPVSQDWGYSPGQGYARFYALNDGGVDVIGGNRGPQPTHDAMRGRFQWWHKQEVTDGMFFQGQVAYTSDQNFLEQFFRNDFIYGPNQETFAYLTYQHQNLWSSGLINTKIGQQWIDRTEWLPRLNGAVTGQSFWDLFVYNARANAGYAQLRPSTVNPFPVLPTDQRVNTGRFDLNQDVSLPFDLGPVKLAPYGVLDLTYYTEDLTGNDRGRAYGGGGVRGSLPLSRLYESVSSDLFNVRGLYHKVTLTGNYYYAQSSVPYSQLPLLDQLDDDVTNYTYRYIRPHQTQFVTGPAGVALATSPLFDQQQYAIRRLVDNRVDTLGDINVLQGELRQRFQTKRGYPGLEHTVDWISLDLSGSYFPQANRDNFGKQFAFLEYNGLWNIGDRTSISSAGWFDPFEFGTRYWNVGMYLDRPDRTSYYIGYRQTDPLNSKAVTGSLQYQLSRRYSAGLGFSYDFGIQKAMSNSFNITRTGADVTFTIGLTYNALVNNLGVQFLLVPNFLSSLAGGKLGSGFGSSGTGFTGR